MTELKAEYVHTIKHSGVMPLELGVEALKWKLGFAQLLVRTTSKTVAVGKPKISQRESRYRCFKRAFEWTLVDVSKFEPPDTSGLQHDPILNTFTCYPLLIYK